MADNRCDIPSATNPFSSRRELLLWALRKSRGPLSALPPELVASRIVPWLAPALDSGSWVLSDHATLAADNPKVVVAAPSGCGTTMVPWSVPILNDGASWRVMVRMSPLGLLGIDNVLQYDAAAALVRRRSATGGWGSPEGIAPPINRRGRRASGVVVIDVDTKRWMFRIGLDKWLSEWAPLCVVQPEHAALNISVVLLRNGAKAEFLDPWAGNI